MLTNAQLANDHYPVDLIDVWRAGNGVRFVMRPVLPQDERPLGEMVVRLSRTSRYRRFHGSMRELPQQSLRHMTRVDYRQHMALVVTTAGTGGEIVIADARYSVNEAGDAAEFAVVVDDAWQRRGLGRRAMRALGSAAARAGVQWLHGSVLVDNEPMLALMIRCGFACTFDHDEEELMQVEKRLFNEPAAGSASDASSWPHKLFKEAMSLFAPQFR